MSIASNTKKIGRMAMAFAMAIFLIGCSDKTDKDVELNTDTESANAYSVDIDMDESELISSIDATAEQESISEGAKLVVIDAGHQSKGNLDKEPILSTKSTCTVVSVKMRKM